ncbi:WGR domain protein [Ostertagia ostertagi]
MGGKSTGKSKGSRKRSERVVVVVKGGVAVDHELEQPFRDTVHVLTELDTVWDVMLNQTNISMNNNKYYLIQLLKSDTDNKYWTWMRWGRVGYRGQSSLVCYDSRLEDAKRGFCAKFLAKTRNEWSERSSFVAYPGKYAIVVTKTGAPVKNEDENEERDCKPLQPSKLDSRVQLLMGLITNMQKMEEDVIELEYDLSRAPLGNLTTEQITEGYTCLREIEEAINTNKFGSRFYESVNKYYTTIPHDFGFRPPPLIKTREDLKKELLLLETLKDIQTSCKILAPRS